MAIGVTAVSGYRKKNEKIKLPESFMGVRNNSVQEMSADGLVKRIIRYPLFTTPGNSTNIRGGGVQP